ncbi:MAG: response regulator transcription factor [Rhodobacteraceae bacterium]|nr:response regulator transcription factor [Paracoccaceae bacterium]
MLVFCLLVAALADDEVSEVADGSRVLVVEDNADIRSLLESSIRNEGFHVRATETLEDCRAAVAEFDATLFVIDVDLPDGNGLSLVRELRAQGNVGILMLSDRAAEVDQVLGLEMGADDYVAKPFRPRELVARLRAIERRVLAAPAPGQPGTPGGDAPDFTVAGYRLFLQARRLLDPGGAEVPLTSAEFDVLAALMEFRGKVANRDQIIEAVRRRNWSGNERAIDGIVSRLRRKLPMQDAQAHFIRTVHGVGYMVVT